MQPGETKKIMSAVWLLMWVGLLHSMVVLTEDPKETVLPEKDNPTDTNPRITPSEGVLTVNPSAEIHSEVPTNPSSSQPAQNTLDLNTKETEIADSESFSKEEIE